MTTQPIKLSEDEAWIRDAETSLKMAQVLAQLSATLLIEVAPDEAGECVKASEALVARIEALLARRGGR